jgi:hypothetical protein
VLNGSGGEIVGVMPGTPVKITSTDSVTLQGTAKVSAVLDQVTPGSTNFVIKAVLPNPAGRFHSGMVITGLVSRQPTRGLVVPRTAFTDDSQSAVETIAGGVVKTIPVTMVAEDGKTAVVQGLSPGEAVIQNGQLGLSDGQPVQRAGTRPQAVAENS